MSISRIKTAFERYGKLPWGYAREAIRLLEEQQDKIAELESEKQVKVVELPKKPWHDEEIVKVSNVSYDVELKSTFKL